MLPKKSPKIFRWPEMCPLSKILAQDFEIAAVTKILWRDKSVVPLLSTDNCKNTPNKNAHIMYGGDCDAVIAKVAVAVTHVQSQSQEVRSGDEGQGLFGFDLSSAETDFWWLENLRLSFSFFV